jgi:chromosome partitioning protein
MMKTIAFFSNNSGVGTTALVYHLAWMYAELGINVIAADLDPQANLTSMFLEEERLLEIWPDNEHVSSILGTIRPILKGTGDITAPYVENISDRLGLIAGDLGLSGFEDKLSDAWPRRQGGDEADSRVMSALYRIVKQAVEAKEADIALIDVGPNLGAINRAAMIAANFVVIPLAPDLYSLQGLKNLGPTLRRWREHWKERIPKNPAPRLPLPGGEMQPVGYVIMQHAMRSDRPVKAYGNWLNRIPGEYRESVMAETPLEFENILTDPYCLALIRHFRSLMPMAMEARKPMFQLKPADGAIGAHMAAVQDCMRDFRNLARKIADKCEITIN